MHLKATSVKGGNSGVSSFFIGSNRRKYDEKKGSRPIVGDCNEKFENKFFPLAATKMGRNQVRQDTETN